MSIYNSILPFTGDGVRTRWEISFSGGYIDPAHVFVRTGTVSASAILDGPNTVVITPAVPLGTLFAIVRRTPVDQPLVDFTAGAGFSEKNLDTAVRQAVLSAAEFQDTAQEFYSSTVSAPLGETLSPLPPAAQRVSTVLGFGSTGDTDLVTLTELAAGVAPYIPNAIIGATGPTGPVDTAFRSELLAATGSTLIKTKQSGLGASTRFLVDKINDSVHIKDYGGVADGVTDNTDAIQKAIASGADEIRFGRGVYAYRTQARTTDPLSVHIHDGHAIIIPIGRQVAFRGTGIGGTVLAQLSVNGNSNNADWQVVFGRVWRGAGIYLKGSSTPPANPGDGTGITLIDITLSGGVSYGGVAFMGQGGANYPANTATGQGWDVEHKGIYCEPDRYTDHIRLIRARITGFGGECTYQGGSGHRELTILDSMIDNTNGDAINPCCEFVNVRGLVIERAFQAMEGWTGRNGYIEFTAKDCLFGGAMQGGKAAAGTYSSYYAPGRYSDGVAPIGTVHLKFIKCGMIYVGSFLNGSIDVIDGTLTVGEVAVFADGVRDTDLDIRVTCDTLSLATAMNIQPGAAAGTQLTDTLRLRVTCGRTKEAKAAGRAITYPIRWGGSLGPNIYIEAGTLDALQPPQQYGTVSGYAPAFTSLLALGTGAGLALWNVETTPTILPLGPVLILTSTTASGTFAGTLSDTNAQPGQILELRNGSGVKAYAITNSSNGSIGREAVIPPYHTMRYQYSHQGFWLPITEPPALKGTATLDILAMLANAVSVEQTITVLGARVGAPVTVSTSVTIAANATVTGAYVSATDTVKFRLRDLTGAGYDPANAVYTATVGNYA